MNAPASPASGQGQAFINAKLAGDERLWETAVTITSLEGPMLATAVGDWAIGRAPVGTEGEEVGTGSTLDLTDSWLIAHRYLPLAMVSKSLAFCWWVADNFAQVFDGIRDEAELTQWVELVSPWLQASQEGARMPLRRWLAGYGLAGPANPYVSVPDLDDLLAAL